MNRLIFTLFGLFFGLSACEKPQVGPFYPSDPQACASDVDCALGHTCRFPAVDTHAICMPGDNSSIP